MGSNQSELKPPWEASPEYRHQDRQMPYRSEELEISPREQVIINKLVSHAEAHKDDAPSAEPKHEGPVKVIFDTDIGTDIDDALALLAALHLPKDDIQLLAITTTYGWTNIRASVARKIIDAYYGDINEKKPKVVAGAGVPIGTHRAVWHTGTEGYSALSAEEIVRMRDESNKIAEPTSEAAQLIVDLVSTYPGEVVLLGLGALTNIGKAILLGGDKFKKDVKRIVYMGQGHRVREQYKALPSYFAGPEEDTFTIGRAYPFYPNHNLSGDTLGAMITFESGIPLTMVNDAVTNQLWFSGKECLSLVEATSPPECAEVGKLLRVWLTYRSIIFFKTVKGTCPHDALTMSEAVYPKRFCKYMRGHVVIHEWAAFSTFIPDPTGPHEIGASIEAEGFLQWLRPLLAPPDMKSDYSEEKGSVLEKVDDEFMKIKMATLKK